MKPSDVIEGKLGNGYFASALACLAERPSLIQKLFVTQEYQREGIYKVQICKDGIWQEVTLDDYFPCGAANGGSALFSKSSTSDIWVLLLEKAYAKLNLNYITLRGGFVCDALQDLIGCPAQTVQLDTEEVQADVRSGKLFLSLE